MKSSIQIWTELLGVSPTFIGTADDGLYTWDNGSGLVRQQWTDRTHMVGWSFNKEPRFIFSYHSRRPLRLS